QIMEDTMGCLITFDLNIKELEKYFNGHVCLGCSTRFLNIPFSSLMTFTYQYKGQDKIIVFYSKLLIQRNFRHFEIFRDQIIKTLKNRYDVSHKKTTTKP
ncbi:MAG: hypothetical protein IIT71_04390, partial [Acetobacter sp.]|nr:hypothetical protein [Acetobacter sp.]